MRRITNIETYLKENSIIDPITNCWLWQKCLDEKGYGIAFFRSRKVKTHRLSAHFYLGLILDDKKLRALHIRECPNKHCCNPEHLYIGNDYQNKQDSIAIGTSTDIGFENRNKTHCKNGHELSGDNLYTRTDGGRGCKICHRNNTNKSTINYTMTKN